MSYRVRATASAIACLMLASSWCRAGDGQFVPVDEVHPGDMCVGRSVFSGTTVEDFDVEILGVVRGTAPGSDLIIARASGGVLDEAGISQGMSGSPVYLDGRLIGAISATWGFSKEPIAGITPIGEMLPALDAGDSGSAGAGGGAMGLSLVPAAERAACGLRRISELAGVDLAEPVSRDGSSFGEYAGREMTAISLPLVVSGGSESLLRQAGEVLGGRGFTPVRGAAAGSVDDGGELVPGSSVGVQFVGGDMSWTAIGTLTYRDGDRVIAFGHPVFEAGAVAMPLVGAYVHTVVPMVSVSFKYASGTGVVGTIRADRRRAVGGVLGPGPDTIPLSVALRTDGGASTDYHFDVMRTNSFSSLFAGLAAAGAVSEAALTAGRASVDLRATIDTPKGPVSYRALFQTSEPAFRVGGELAALMDVVMDSPFENVDVTGVSLDVVITEGEFIAAIESVSADRAVYAPGDPVVLTVDLRDWQGEAWSEELVLNVPEDSPEGSMIVRVGGASAFHEWDAERLGGGLRPRNWEQLRDLIEESKPGNVVVAQLLSQRPGLSLSGRELKRVPGKAALVMGAASESGNVQPADLSVLSEASFSADREVRGFHEFVLFAKARD